MRTKLRLHLRVRVPNEGARRLANWIMKQPDGTLCKLLRKTGIGEISIDRMMAGELTPDAPIAYQIYAFTRCTVPISAWDRAPEAGWFDPIADVGLRRAA